MNKSKFLKRSLAALLSILMVATMIPSAFAAVVTAEDVPTARAADPGYNISVDGNRATWDSANDAYTVSTSFEEGNTPTDFKVSMIEVKNHTVTVPGIDGADKKLIATVKTLLLDKAEKSVDSFGVGTYTYNAKAVVTNDEGDVQSTTEFKLIVTLKMEPKSSDATLKAIKSARLPYAIKAEFDNAKNTIDIVMALTKNTAYDSTMTVPVNGVDTDIKNNKDELMKIFVPTNDKISNMSYNPTAKTLTVTAKNGDKKVYAVKFTEEPAFDTFKLGDFEGKTVEGKPRKIIIDLPYEYLNDSANNLSTAGKAKLEKMLATWTVPTGNKVYLGSAADAKESGKETLVFKSTIETSDSDITGDNSKYIAVEVDTTKTVKVQTKKSADKEEVEVFVRVPKKNPDAALTGIQIVDNTYVSDSTDPAADYTQFIPIDKDQRDIPVELPNGMKKDANAETGYSLSINVWGAKNSWVELADGRVSGSNAFADDTGDANEGKGVQLDTDGEGTSANPINVSKAITLKVLSEDEATTLYYTLTVKESTSSAATLESLKVVNAKGEEVGTVKQSTTDSKAYTITLPYKYGTNTPDPADLEVIAKGSESAKIGYIDGHDLTTGGSAEVPATSAVYKYVHTAITDFDADPSDNTGATKLTYATMTVGGVSVQVPEVTTTYSTAKKQVAYFVENATAPTGWGITVDGEDEDGETILFTATNPGELGSQVMDPNPPASAPAGMTKVTNGSDTVAAVPGTPVTWTPFVKSEDIRTLVDENTGITLPLASKAEDNNATLEDSSANPNYNPAVENKFMLKVFNGADNGENVYKITINKADPNTEAIIKSAKVTDSATRATMTEYDTTVSTRDAKDTSVIKVSELPHALDEVDMRFSELEVSDEARVVIHPNPATALPTPAPANVMSVDKTTDNNSNTFDVGAGSSCWDEKDKYVEVWVFSEEDWYKTGMVGNIANATRARATKIYKMSATYTPAETGSELTSVKSTLDPTIDVSMASKTVTITVPYSYLYDNQTAEQKAANYGQFSLDITTSKLATVHAGAISGDTNKIVPDQGKVTTPSRTMFIAKKDAGDGNKVKLYKVTGDTKTEKMIVQAESTKNTGDYNIKVLVKPVETSYAINSISAAGKSAVKSADGEVWTLKIPATVEKLQLVDIVTASKLAKVKVDGADYDKETYFDLGDDLKIEVTAENGDAFTYTLKIEEETNLSKETGISSISVSSFVVTKTGNAYTVKVPEAEEVTALPLTINLVDSKAAVTVNGKAYAAGMKVDLTTAATIVVTAEDGTTATTYTLTAEKGSASKPSDDYTDVPAGELGDYVKQVIDNGIMKGNSATTFNPKGQITRFEFALLIARADLRVKDSAVNNADEADAELIKQYSGKSAYADPKNVELYDAAIEYCTKNSIINGVGNNRFNPDGIVTREMAAKMVTLWAGVADEKLTNNDNKLNDWTKISTWAKPFVNSAYKAKFMQGVGNNNFGPNVTLTRDQVAKIIMLAYNHVAGAN